MVQVATVAQKQTAGGIPYPRRQIALCGGYSSACRKIASTRAVPASRAASRSSTGSRKLKGTRGASSGLRPDRPFTPPLPGMPAMSGSHIHDGGFVVRVVAQELYASAAFRTHGAGRQMAVAQMLDHAVFPPIEARARAGNPNADLGADFQSDRAVLAGEGNHGVISVSDVLCMTEKHGGVNGVPGLVKDCTHA